ncbi:magnesium transporter MgtC [Sphingobacterium faecium NBRC 15299]|uniref:MgtC/SapB family protein n=2 Tax=Sphingobacterium faecium TaxID=34087 RepID=UPI000D3378E5|nr:MgtC/SapB family protein [Sphingobacterium faecium]MQP29508.1 MgtC/SapB family protein [Sphingobacterium faecium]PTX09855.1 putative Mg2+ transporter-C (MgtC) family protein [Sphingobacterium faecium]GEM63541.1 magnesium transporter MgtC [Sphingobacterium faecium NBRC 15299]
MDFTVEINDMVAMVISIICGGAIGFEREYKNKSAGFRTIILISLGSTIFTIVSQHGTGTDDRISANIITGIGFIGAGVIFKDKISIRGLTTAAVIWTSAAIGMTAGIGYHALALCLTLITLGVLLMVTRVERMIAQLQKEQLLSVTFRDPDFDQVPQLENILNTKGLTLERMEIVKENDHLIVNFKVSGKKRYLLEMSETLATRPEILSFS